MNEQTYTLVKISDNGRVHRSVRSKQRTWCGLGWTGLSSDLVTLKTVGAIEADPNRFLCERCFPPTLRRHALLVYRRPDVAAAEDLLREAGLAKRDFAHTLVDHSGAPDRFIRWESGEVWDWTPGAEQLVMFAAALGHSLDTGDRPRPFPKPARLTLGLPHYRLNTPAGPVKGVLAYRYWNTGECSVAVVAKEGGVADWGAYIGALPNIPAKGAWDVVHEAAAFKEGATVADTMIKAKTNSKDLRDLARDALATRPVSEEEVVAHVIREGAKLSPDEARAFFGPGGIGIRRGRSLPMEAYRP